MSKARVYELAKELGLENKDLISRLEKLGIAVKSHSSTLEDDDVERIRGEFSTGSSKGIEETRVKSTVIRRRAVRIEETAPIAEESLSASESSREEQPEQFAEMKGVEPEVVAEQQAAARTDETSKHEQPPAPGEQKTQLPEKESQQPAAARPVAEQPGRKPAEPAAPASKETTAEDALKAAKKTKKPVEIVMEENAAKKKPLFKQAVAGKKDKRWEKDAKETDDDRPSKWKDGRKQAPVIKMKKTEITTPKAIKRRIKVAENIQVAELAKRLGVKVGEVINKLIKLGIMASMNQSVDLDTATLIAAEFGYQVEAANIEYDEAMTKQDDEPRNLKPRAPVVTVMGHVDHGKTSLLDAIRQTNVIDGEAGGITQAIGAYHVTINDREIVFLDTPGHEAFTSMRARGAQATDIVILVVAADDGVMEQTVEAINHAKAAKVPIIVAVNKMDKPSANPDKITRELADYGLVSEEWGGDTLFAKISAKKKEGIDELLELVLLQADVMELQADPDRPARGVIIEAQLDKGRGPVATVLIQEGTLNEGDAFVCKTEFGRVRALVNDKGQRIRSAGPSMPVEVIGFSNVPSAGTDFVVVEDERKARTIGEYWLRKERERELTANSKVTLEQLYNRIKEGAKEFNVIIKGDVQGSIEAVSEALLKLSTQDVRVKVIHSSPGTVTETDVLLASASDAVVIGFKVRPDARVVEIAKVEGVEIKLYDIIYNIINDVRSAMEGLLEPTYKEVAIGRAEVRETFKVPKIGTIAGSYILDGKVTRDAKVRLVRNGVTVYDGKIFSLKRFKDDAKEVAAGYECGIGIEGYNDLKIGDIIEAYIEERVERKL